MLNRETMEKITELQMSEFDRKRYLIENFQFPYIPETLEEVNQLKIPTLIRKEEFSEYTFNEITIKEKNYLNGRERLIKKYEEIHCTLLPNNIELSPCEQFQYLFVRSQQINIDKYSRHWLTILPFKYSNPLFEDFTGYFEISVGIMLNNGFIAYNRDSKYAIRIFKRSSERPFYFQVNCLFDTNKITNIDNHIISDMLSKKLEYMLMFEYGFKVLGNIKVDAININNKSGRLYFNAHDTFIDAYEKKSE